MTDLTQELADLLKEAFSWEDVEGCEEVDSGEWEQEHKYQNRRSILLYKGQHFAYDESRSGSYHTDWYYNESYLTPVVRKEETKVVVSWDMAGPQVTVPSRD